MNAQCLIGIHGLNDLEANLTEEIGDDHAGLRCGHAGRGVTEMWLVPINPSGGLVPAKQNIHSEMRHRGIKIPTNLSRLYSANSCKLN